MSELVIADGSLLPPDPNAVPEWVTMRQACLELEDAGLLDNVEALVATLPRSYQIEWQRASIVERTNGLVEIVRQQENLSMGDIDDLFRRAVLR